MNHKRGAEAGGWPAAKRPKEGEDDAMDEVDGFLDDEEAEVAVLGVPDDEPGLPEEAKRNSWLRPDLRPMDARRDKLGARAALHTARTQHAHA